MAILDMSKPSAVCVSEAIRPSNASKSAARRSACETPVNTSGRTRACCSRAGPSHDPSAGLVPGQRRPVLVREQAAAAPPAGTIDRNPAPIRDEIEVDVDGSANAVNAGGVRDGRRQRGDDQDHDQADRDEPPPNFARGLPRP
jgi:hypothetical protein